MDTLKRSLGLMIIAVFTFCYVTGQTVKLQDAFSQSYAYEKSGETAKAIEALKTVYDANSYELNLRLGWLNYSAGSFTEATAYYNKAVTLSPNSVEAKLGLVMPLASLGKWDDVIKQYLDILSIDPKNSLVNYRMGSIYYSKNDFSTAFKYLEKGLSMYPFDYDLIILTAWTYYKMGKMNEAKALFQRALLNRPDDSSAKEGLGLIK
jgi:tetratricopeptide (TPR) repeat protein